MDVLDLAPENQQVSSENKKIQNGHPAACPEPMIKCTNNLKEKRRNCDVPVNTSTCTNFDVDIIAKNVKHFKYYTAIVPDQYEGILRFLVQLKLMKESFLSSFLQTESKRL